MVDEEDLPVVVRTLFKTARERDSALVRAELVSFFLRSTKGLPEFVFGGGVLMRRRGVVFQRPHVGQCNMKCNMVLSDQCFGGTQHGQILWYYPFNTLVEKRAWMYIYEVFS